MQCGIACLAMVCRYYGRKHSLDTISRICFATNEGVSLLGISQAAKRLGFRTVCGRIATEQLADTALPCILHWNQNHFVVLYKVAHDGRKYYVADPGKGKVRYSKEEFERHWVSMRSDGGNKGIAMFLTPTDDSCDHHEERKEKRKLFRFLWSYVMEYRKYFFQILLGLVLGCVLQLIMPFLMQGIVDLGIRHRDVGLIWMILLGEMMIVTGRTATDFIRRWLLLHISMRINISIVSDFFIKLLKTAYVVFRYKVDGRLVTTYWGPFACAEFSNRTGAEYSVHSLEFHDIWHCPFCLQQINLLRFCCWEHYIRIMDFLFSTTTEGA